MKKYSVSARVQLDFIWSADDLYYENSEQAEVDALRGIRENFIDGDEVQEENLKISELKIVELR